MKFQLVLLLAVLTSAVGHADELPETDLLHWRVPVAPKRLPPPEPALLDECTVNKDSALYKQTLVYLSGLKMKSDESSGYRPYVTGICPGGEAEAAGFREGDIVRAITPVPLNQGEKAYARDIASITDFEEQLFHYRGKPVEILVVRHDTKISLPSFVPKAGEASRQPASVAKPLQAAQQF